LFAQFEDNLDDDNGEELSLLKALGSSLAQALEDERHMHGSNKIR
jgi:hypothetical protein